MRFTPEYLTGKVVKGLRGDDPVPYWVNVITSATPDGTGHLRVTSEGPAVLVLDREMPFELPMSERIRSEEAFTFWWKQLTYAFDLQDPRSFPRLDAPLSDDDLNACVRYIETACDLADSESLNGLDQGFFMRILDETGEEVVDTRFGRKDVQIGFSGLVRHCDSRAKKDGARFARIHEVLVGAAEANPDETVRAEQLRQLETWRDMIEQLHSRSVDQCVRDQLVREQEWRAFDYREHYRPDYLIRVYDYGDLLHWGAQTSELAELEADPFLRAFNRHSFFEALAGLAHGYLGFGELVRAALAT